MLEAAHTRQSERLAREIISRAKLVVRDRWQEIEELKLFNQAKLLDAFRRHRVGEHHFAGTTGYGYHDSGRDVIEAIYADVFGAERALVRPQLVSGTHAIFSCLAALLAPGDTLVSLTGAPYDTLQQAIGATGNLRNSLIQRGIIYKEVPLTVTGQIDADGILRTVEAGTRLVMLQRSRGYSWRPALRVEEIAEVVELIRSINPNIVIFVDNCYGEFVEPQEPCEAGVDLIAGSLIKNPGGGLVAGGGYVAGRADLVEAVADQITAPGLGSEMGPTYGFNRWLLQGLWLAPHIVGEALAGAVLAARVWEELGYPTSPRWDEPRGDIVQAVRFRNQQELLAFCQAIQMASPVNSFVRPEAGNMPGYVDPIVMAAGTFVQGSSIELSADAPLRPPYTGYLQGGLCKEHVELALLEIIQHLQSLEAKR